MRKPVLFAVVVVLFAAIAMAASHREITSAEAKKMMEKGSVFLLDVRTPEEFRQARLQGAVLIPVDQVEARLGEIPKNRPVLVYCAVGSRSYQAAALLARKGFKDVSNMSDGIVGWYRNGFPVLR
jgi:rhodanese-related sulfurtransferase